MDRADSSTLQDSCCTSAGVRFLLYVLARLKSLYHAYLQQDRARVLNHSCCSEPPLLASNTCTVLRKQQRYKSSAAGSRRERVAQPRRLFVHDRVVQVRVL